MYREWRIFHFARESCVTFALKRDYYKYINHTRVIPVSECARERARIVHYSRAINARYRHQQRHYTLVSKHFDRSYLAHSFARAPAPPITLFVKIADVARHHRNALVLNGINISPVTRASADWLDTYRATIIIKSNLRGRDRGRLGPCDKNWRRAIVRRVI